MHCKSLRPPRRPPWFRGQHLERLEQRLLLAVDLVVDFVEPPQDVMLGEWVTLTLEVANHGTADAVDVLVTGPLEDLLEDVRWSRPGVFPAEIDVDHLPIWQGSSEEHEDRRSDLNDDGIDDVVTAKRLFPLSESVVTVAFGRAEGAPPSALEPDHLAPPLGFRLHGDRPRGQGTGWFGSSLRAPGDLNGDGIDDLLLGHAHHLLAGRASASGTGGLTDTLDLPATGVARYRIQGRLREDTPPEDLVFKAQATTCDSDHNQPELARVAVDLEPLGAIGARQSHKVRITNLDAAQPIAVELSSTPTGLSAATWVRQIGFPKQIPFAHLEGQNGFVLHGFHAGHVVGDVDGDGAADFTASRPRRFDDNVLYFGIQDIVSRHASGRWTPAPGLGRGIGDFNGDGLADLYSSQSIYLGREDFAWQPHLSFPDRRVGRPLGGGDLNGDGFDDFYMNRSDVRGENRTNRIYFGRGSRRPLNHPLGYVNLPPSLFAVDIGGDVNGDGIDDMVARLEERAYVVFGQRDLANLARLDVANLNGTNGFEIRGHASNVDAAHAIGGDLNGDGFEDLIFTRAGRDAVAIVFGHADIGRSGVLDIEQDPGTLTMDTPGLQFGPRFSRERGDINGDGLADLLIVRPSSRTVKGGGYVVFGDTDLHHQDSIDLQHLDGLNGFTLPQPLGEVYSTATLGDVNGDGTDDLLMSGAHHFDDQQTGETYVVHGKPTHTTFAGPSLVDKLELAPGGTVELTVAGTSTGEAVDLGLIVNAGRCVGQQEAHPANNAATLRLPRLQGDVNADGRLSLDDFLVISVNFGRQHAARGDGDLDGDDAVSFKDFLIFAARFVRQVGGSSSSRART